MAGSLDEELKSIWEVACRWTGLNPAVADPDNLTTPAESHLVQLIDAANSILPRYDKAGDYLPIERLGLLGFRPTKFSLKLHRAHMAAIVRFALATGCRASEITGLEWSRVDLERKNAWG